MLDIALVTAIVVMGMLAARLGILTYCLFTMPGTLAHESAHYIVALLLRARPSFPRVIPKRAEDGGWLLGSVQFAGTALNKAPIALAPLMLIPASILYIGFYMHKAHGWPYMAHAWVAGTMLTASMPSRQDWKLAAPAIMVVLLIAAAIAGLIVLAK